MTVWKAFSGFMFFVAPIIFWFSVPSWMPKWMEAWSVLVFLAGYFLIAAVMIYGNMRWHRHYDR